MCICILYLYLLLYLCIDNPSIIGQSHLEREEGAQWICHHQVSSLFNKLHPKCKSGGNCKRKMFRNILSPTSPHQFQTNLGEILSVWSNPNNQIPERYHGFIGDYLHFLALIYSVSITHSFAHFFSFPNPIPLLKELQMSEGPGCRVGKMYPCKLASGHNKNILPPISILPVHCTSSNALKFSEFNE